MPKLTLIIDSHSLTNWQNCERMYYYNNHLNLRSKNRKFGISKGTVWHKLQYFYAKALKANKNESWILKHLNKWITKQSELDTETQILVWYRFLEYVKEYNPSNRKILGSEVGFSKNLYEDDTILIVYEGMIDSIEIVSGQKIWRDYKTQHPKFTRDHYGYTNQFIGYSWATGITTGLIDYTTFSKTKNDRTFRISAASYPSEVLKQWATQVASFGRQIIRDILTDTFQMRRNSCDGKYGICQFSRLCEQTSRKHRLRIMNNDFEKGEQYLPW